MKLLQIKCWPGIMILAMTSATPILAATTDTVASASASYGTGWVGGFNPVDNCQNIPQDRWRGATVLNYQMTAEEMIAGVATIPLTFTATEDELPSSCGYTLEAIDTTFSVFTISMPSISVAAGSNMFNLTITVDKDRLATFPVDEYLAAAFDFNYHSHPK